MINMHIFILLFQFGTNLYTQVMWHLQRCWMEHSDGFNRSPSFSLMCTGYVAQGDSLMINFIRIERSRPFI